MIEDFSLRPDANVMTRESFPAGTRFHIPSGGTEGGKDGVIVTFGLDTDHEWTGVFAFGLNGAFELNGHLTTKAVIPLANSDRVLVVADGDGFVVREQVPGEFEKVRAVPVRSVHVIESHGIVLLADDISLSAYGERGLVWDTGRIAWDDLRVEYVSGDKTSCVAFDIRSEKDIQFTVDARTGACDGGIEVI